MLVVTAMRPEEHCLNYEETRYDMSIVADAIRTLFTERQKEDESLVAYADRIKALRNIAASQIGDEIHLTTIVNNELLKNQNHTKDAAQHKAWDRLMAFLYIDRADKSKYGQFVENLRVQNSLKNTRYPDAIDEAHAILSAQKVERWKQKSDKNSTSPKNNYINDDDNGSKKSFSQRPKDNMTCHGCEKKGRSATECRDREKIPREKWFINRAMSNM
jgi:hypothetical protein